MVRKLLIYELIRLPVFDTNIRFKSSESTQDLRRRRAKPLRDARWPKSCHNSFRGGSRIFVFLCFSGRITKTNQNKVFLFTYFMALVIDVYVKIYGFDQKFDFLNVYIMGLYLQ